MRRGRTEEIDWDEEGKEKRRRGKEWGRIGDRRGERMGGEMGIDQKRIVKEEEERIGRRREIDWERKGEGRVYNIII